MNFIRKAQWSQRGDACFFAVVVRPSSSAARARLWPKNVAMRKKCPKKGPTNEKISWVDSKNLLRQLEKAALQAQLQFVHPKWDRLEVTKPKEATRCAYTFLFSYGLAVNPIFCNSSFLLVFVLYLETYSKSLTGTYRGGTCLMKYKMSKNSCATNLLRTDRY